MIQTARKKLTAYFFVFAMAILMALNYRVLILENAFAPAGLNGIATMIQYKLNFSVGYMSLLINIPLCLIAFFTVDRDFAAKSLLFSLTFSVFLLIFQYKVDLTPFIYKTENSAILAPLTAGVINGFIYGTVIRSNGSTGGTDIVAACVHEKRPEMNLVWIIFAMNCAVAAASYFVYDYKLEPVILCILYSFLTGKVSDSILRGGKEQLKFEIITSDYEEMSKEIMTKLRHGVTVLPATGMYSGKEMKMVVCIINKHQIAKLRGIIASYPDAFANVTQANEIFGNFKNVRG
ncbi:MAG: YitT family protein [Clostridia bacterium]|nr:YitT family protein [Clostridia bacterium]